MLRRFELWGNWVTVRRRRRNGVGDQAARTSKQERYAMTENRVVALRSRKGPSMIRSPKSCERARAG